MTFVFKHVGIALCAAVLLLVLAATHLDVAVSNWFYDAAAGRFPLRYSSFLETFMHQWAKYVAILLGCSVVGAFLFSFTAERLRPWRRALLFLGLSLALAPAAVASLKSVGHQHCPYELAEYGGFAPYNGLLESPPSRVKPGQCLLSGHAATGYSLLAFYFLGLALGRPALARLGLWGGLGAGTVFGITRVAQGSHFLSGVLWPGLICWIVILALYLLLFGSKARGPESVAAARSAEGAGTRPALGSLRGELADPR